MVVEQKCEGLMVKLLENGEGITGDDDEDEDTGGVGGGAKKKKGNGGKKKPLPATYEPDQRSQGWLKVKKGQSCQCHKKFVSDTRRLPGRLRRFVGSGPNRRMVGSRS